MTEEFLHFYFFQIPQKVAYWKNSEVEKKKKKI